MEVIYVEQEEEWTYITALWHAWCDGYFCWKFSLKHYSLDSTPKERNPQRKELIQSFSVNLWVENLKSNFGWFTLSKALLESSKSCLPRSANNSANCISQVGFSRKSCWSPIRTLFSFRCRARFEATCSMSLHKIWVNDSDLYLRGHFYHLFF